MAIEIGTVGIWTTARMWPRSSLGEVVAELEELGYGALWLGSSPPGDLRLVEELLAASTTLPVATGILNVWDTEPDEVAAAYRRVSASHPGRFILGIGSGHGHAKPYQRLVEFLDVFDTSNVPADHRILAALGPRVLALAAARTAGALPYNTTPEHTAMAREILGPDRILAPEVMVVLETEPDRARATGRERLAPYLELTHYIANLRRLGFTEEDLSYGGSDRLVDALIAWGDEEAIRGRIAEHFAAGADHVPIQVLNPGPERLATLRTLAPVLLGVSR